MNFEKYGIHFGGGMPTILIGQRFEKILNMNRAYNQLEPNVCINIEDFCISLYREDMIAFRKRIFEEFLSV